MATCFWPPFWQMSRFVHLHLLVVFFKRSWLIWKSSPKTMRIWVKIISQVQHSVFLSSLLHSVAQALLFWGNANMGEIPIWTYQLISTGSFLFLNSTGTYYFLWVIWRTRGFPQLAKMLACLLCCIYVCLCVINEVWNPKVVYSFYGCNLASMCTIFQIVFLDQNNKRSHDTIKGGIV